MFGDDLSSTNCLPEKRHSNIGLHLFYFSPLCIFKCNLGALGPGEVPEQLHGEPHHPREVWPIQSSWLHPQVPIMNWYYDQGQVDIEAKGDHSNLRWSPLQCIVVILRVTIVTDGSSCLPPEARIKEGVMWKQVDLIYCRKYSHFRNYAPPPGCKRGHNYEKSFPCIFWEFFLDLFWLGHVHLGVNGCHRKVGISNVKK